MNAKFYSLIAALSITAACGGDFERDGGNTANDTAADTADIDLEPAYSVEDGVLTISSDFNPYGGESTGLFGDQFGANDGWQYAVRLISPDEDNNLLVPLGVYGTAVSTRWALALVDEDLAPDAWLWESGQLANELSTRDPLGLTVWVEECGVMKLNFCTRVQEDGSIVAGECALTYVPPQGCADEDNDGDTDPEQNPDDDGGGDTDDGGTDGTDEDHGEYGTCDSGWSAIRWFYDAPANLVSAQVEIREGQTTSGAAKTGTQLFFGLVDDDGTESDPDNEAFETAIDADEVEITVNECWEDGYTVFLSAEYTSSRWLCEGSGTVNGSSTLYVDGTEVTEVVYSKPSGGCELMYYVAP